MKVYTNIARIAIFQIYLVLPNNNSLFLYKNEFFTNKEYRPDDLKKAYDCFRTFWKLINTDSTPKEKTTLTHLILLMAFLKYIPCKFKCFHAVKL